MPKRGPSLRAQWLGKLLREHREAAGLKLTDAGEYIQRTQGTVSRMERGEVPPRPPDVIAMLNLYRVDDQTIRDAMEQLSREVFRAGWWEGHGEHLADWFVDLAWLESRARTIRSYDAVLMPGLLQTREYADAVIRAVESGASEQQIEQWVEFRMERQNVLDGDECPRLTVLIEESVILRSVGNRRAASAQLKHLLAMAQRPSVTVRVVPLSAPIPASNSGTFSVIDMGEPFSQVGYAETLGGSLFVEGERAERFIQTYANVEAYALSESKSRDLIERVTEQ